MTRRPRVVLLAYYYPPVSTVGSVRALSIAKYLTRLNWEVTVVTPATSVWRRVDGETQIDESMEKLGVRCLRTGHDWRSLSPEDLVTSSGGISWVIGGICRRVARAFYIEHEVGWVREAQEGCRCLDPGDVDVVLATGPPFRPFRLARDLATRFGVPYVLDYRDLWTGNPHLVRVPPRRVVEAEKDLVCGAAAVTTVSSSLASCLNSQFPVGAKVEVITNGFDPDDLESVRPHPFDHFALVYTGVFYPPKRVITPVMAALQRLQKRPSHAPRDWAFHYYGAHNQHVSDEAQRFGVQDRVVLHGRVPRREALSAVAGASLTVVITSVLADGSTADKGIVTGKVFEAIGLKRPILGIAPRGSDLERVVEGTGLGRCFEGSDTAEIADFVTEAMIGPPPEPENLEQFGWPSIARRLERVLQDAIGANKNVSTGQA